jgi:NAD(P)-dependent dehydrogenase (short-subunit alcohol dehydrogenase family)
VLLRTLGAALDHARLVVVGADPVSGGRRPADLDDLTFSRPELLGEPAGIRPFFAYGRTKTMDAMFVFELARRLAGTAVTVNIAHPGVIPGTGLSDEAPGLTEQVYQAFRDGLLAPPGRQPGGHAAPSFAAGEAGPSTDTGADTPAWLATSPEADGITGRFFVDRQPVETAPHTTDPARCALLWEQTARLTGMPV